MDMVKLYDTAKLDDVPALLTLCAEGALQYDSAGNFKFNATVFSNTLIILITQPTTAVIIEKTGSVITGVIAVVTSTHYYSTAIIASKLFWLANSKKSAVKLLQIAKSWAKSQGATKFALSQPHYGKSFGSMASVEMHFIEDL